MKVQLLPLLGEMVQPW